MVHSPQRPTTTLPLPTRYQLMSYHSRFCVLFVAVLCKPFALLCLFHTSHKSNGFAGISPCDWQQCSFRAVSVVTLSAVYSSAAGHLHDVMTFRWCDHCWAFESQSYLPDSVHLFSMKPNILGTPKGSADPCTPALH